MNMKMCGRRNVMKHKDIKDSDNYTILGIWLKFGSMDKMGLKSSKPEDYLGITGKGLIISLGLKTTKSKDIPLLMLL